jgi:hypothetical protein
MTNISQLRSMLDNVPESIEEGSTSPFVNGTRAEERERTRTSLSDSVNRGEPSSSPPDPSPADGATGLGFGVAVSGGDASIGLDIAISPYLGSGSEFVQTKRNRVEDQDQEEEGGDEVVAYSRAAMKRWRGDSGQVRFFSLLIEF